MAGVTIILSVTLLAITLTSHCVFSLDYDDVELTALNGFVDATAEGKFYPSPGGDVEKLSDPPCCLVYSEGCDGESIPLFHNECSCNVVYRGIDCRSGMIPFYNAVANMHRGRAVVFTTFTGYRERLQDLYDGLNNNLTNPYFIIPIIFVDHEGSKDIWALKDERNVTLRITRIPSMDNPPGNGLENTRSATTFYFVVFAFTILLLLSLTWFVFNYLRRCHHMYTLKRQRAELLSKTRKAIEKCPTKTYKKARKTGQRTVSKDDTDSVTSEEEERCPICLETFKMKDVLRVLPCHHEFHKSCIDPWLYEKGTCPMCKLNIVGNQEECDSEQVSREIRILTMPVGFELEMLEEGLPTAESDHNNVNQQSNTDENLQVESIE